MIIGWVIFIFSFISNRKHLLATLLRLEGVILMVFGVLRIASSMWMRYPLFIILFIVLVACEGALGLSLLVRVVRSHGGDYFNSLNSLQC